NRQRSFHRTSGSALMPAASEFLRSLRDIHRALAPQAHAISPVAQLAEEQRNFYAFDRERVINQPLAMLFQRIRPLHIVSIDIHPRQLPLTMQVSKRRAQQSHLRRRAREINTLSNRHRIRSRAHQFLRQRKRPLARAHVAERSRIRQHRRVQTRRDFRADLHSGLARQPEYHLCRRASVRIDPVHICERSRARMMIDVDEVMTVQPLEPRSLDAVALQDDCRLVVFRNTRGLQHLVGKWQWPINLGHSIEQVDIGLFSHAAEDLTARQHRPDRIAIRPRVRGQHKTTSPADLVEYLLQHPALLLFLVLLCPLIYPRQQFVDSSRHLLRSIQRPQQVRRVTERKVFRKLVLDVPGRRTQSFHRRRRFLVVASHRNEYPHRLSTLVDDQVRYRNQSDARIRKLSREDRAQLLFQGFRQPLPVILLSSSFHRQHLPLLQPKTEVKLFNLHRHGPSRSSKLTRNFQPSKCYGKSIFSHAGCLLTATGYRNSTNESTISAPALFANFVASRSTFCIRPS